MFQDWRLVAIATVAAEELDLSCEGYFFGGIVGSLNRLVLGCWSDWILVHNTYLST